MDWEKLGNFLNGERLEFNLAKLNRERNLFILRLLMVFFFCGIILEAGAFTYIKVKYSLPNAATIEENYARAQKINNDIKKGNRDLQQVQKDNLEIITFFTMLAQYKPKNIALTNVSMDNKGVKLKGEGTDLSSVNKFAQDLKTGRFSESRVERLEHKNTRVSFLIVMKIKEADKGTKANGAKAATAGGKEIDV